MAEAPPELERRVLEALARFGFTKEAGEALENLRCVVLAGNEVVGVVPLTKQTKALDERVRRMERWVERLLWAMGGTVGAGALNALGLEKIVAAIRALIGGPP